MSKGRDQAAKAQRLVAVQPTASQTPKVRTKNVRLSVDLNPNVRRGIDLWAAELAESLGHYRIPAAEVMRVFAQRLLEDEKLQQIIADAIREVRR